MNGKVTNGGIRRAERVARCPLLKGASSIAWINGNIYTGAAWDGCCLME